MLIYKIHSFLLFIALCTISLDAAEKQSQAQKLSLAKCQEIALTNSEDLSIAELETLMANDEIRVIQGNNLPVLTATGNYISRNNHRGAVFWARPEHGGGEGQDHKHKRPRKEKIKTIGGNKQIRTARLSLVVPIYDFDVVSNLVKSQKMMVTSSIHDRERIKQDLLYAVTQSYYKILEGEKIEAVVKLSIHALKKQLAVVSDFFQVGLVTKNDVLVVEVQMAEREQELIQARHNVELAISELNRLMGQSIHQSTQIENIIEECSWEKNLDETIAKAKRNHPYLKSLHSQKEAAVFDCKSEKRRLLPNIVGFSSVNACSDSYLLHKHWIDFGFGIEVPIFDGGITYARIDQKNSAISEAELQYKAAVKDIELEIKNAFLDVQSAFHRIPVARKSVILAEENLKIARDQFQEGMLTSSDVLDDEERLDIARSNYYQSLYAFHKAKSQLEYAAGLIQKTV
jgi:outer membrane protein